LLTLTDEQREALSTSRPTVARWKRRFEESGMAGLEPRHKRSQPRTATPAVQAKVLRKTAKAPADASPHWSCRKMAAAAGVSKSAAQPIWAAADIIALSMNPTQHAVFFFVDEKTAIQALDRLQPVLPPSPARAEKHGFERCGLGTLSLHAALDVRAGKVEGKTAKRHNSAEFIEFLGQVVVTAPGAQDRQIPPRLREITRPFHRTCTDLRRRIGRVITGTDH
jgi:hypothetical protein